MNHKGILNCLLRKMNLGIKTFTTEEISEESNKSCIIVGGELIPLQQRGLIRAVGERGFAFSCRISEMREYILALNREETVDMIDEEVPLSLDDIMNSIWSMESAEKRESEAKSALSHVQFSRLSNVLDDDDDEETADFKLESILRELEEEKNNFFEKVYGDDIFSLMPRSDDLGFWRYDIRIHARVGGGWMIRILLKDTERSGYRLEKQESTEKRKWFHYESDGETFVAECAPAMLSFVLAKFYLWIEAPENILRTPGERQFDAAAHKMLQLIVSENDKMSRTDAISRVKAYDQYVWRGEDWYLMAVTRSVMDALNDASDDEFEEWKKEHAKTD